MSPGRRSAAASTAIALTLVAGGCTGTTANPASPGAVGTSGAASASGTTSGSSPSASTNTPRQPGSPSPTSSPAAASDDASRVLATMSLQQRVGQLIMVGGGATGVSSATLTAISRDHIGNAMLTGRSALGKVATVKVTAGLRARATTAATADVGLFIATDQEGGQVQVLSGPGFSTLPTGLTQGTWTPATLRSRATGWGRQLRSAGVNVNLAPVTDTVPRAMARSNRPIGYYQREFGYDTATVGPHAVAFVQGMQAAGVAATPKHFPGLGRVTGNTDTTSGVTDSTTTRSSAYLNPFRQAIAAGAPFVMISSAYYSQIDAGQPAPFSRTIITGVLRGDLGFRGVVISDDLGLARQVSRWSPGSRATQFVAAGGDIVLTVDPSLAPAMAKALVAKARSSAAFRKQVDAAALRVLRAKASFGLLPAS